MKRERERENHYFLNTVVNKGYSYVERERERKREERERRKIILRFFTFYFD